MKRLILFFLAFLANLLVAQDSLVLDGKLMVEVPPFVAGDTSRNSPEEPIGITILVLVSNKGESNVRLPTSGAIVDVLVVGTERTIVARWDARKSWNNTPLITPDRKLSIVELRPGESAVIPIDTTVAARDVKTVRKYHIKISEEFAARYGVVSGNWEKSPQLPKW